MTPNPEEFSKDEKPRQWRACFRVTGEFWADIEADSEGEAQVRAKEIAASHDFGLELDEVQAVEISYIEKKPMMYRVVRDGRDMQVSRLQAGDQPRYPRQGGF